MVLSTQNRLMPIRRDSVQILRNLQFEADTGVLAMSSIEFVTRHWVASNTLRALCDWPKSLANTLEYRFLSSLLSGSVGELSANFYHGFLRDRNEPRNQKCDGRKTDRGREAKPADFVEYGLWLLRKFSVEAGKRQQVAADENDQ